MKKLILIALLVATPVQASTVVFEGSPVKKVATYEGESSDRLLNKSESNDYKVRIVKDGEKYLWASRRDIELVPTHSGYYVTYLAVNGSGYVRTFQPDALEMLKAFPQEDSGYLYFEHLIDKMGSVTYYGR